MIRVNLLVSGTEPTPGPWRRWPVVQPEQRAALLGVAMLVTTSASAGLWWWSVDRERRAVNAEIATGELTITRLQDAARVMELSTAREREVRERLSLIDQLRAGQRAPVRLLDAISRSLTDGLWLVELRQTGQALELDGRAISYSALTEFIDRLQVSGRFVRPVGIVTSSTETTGDASVVRFVIRAEVGR